MRNQDEEGGVGDEGKEATSGLHLQLGTPRKPAISERYPTGMT